MKMIKLNFLSVGLLLFAASTSMAGVGSHGGDAVVLDFTRSGYDLYSWLGRNGGDVTKNFDLERFKKVLTAADISSTDTALMLDGVEKDAINTPADHKIVISRKRWQSTVTEVAKWAIVSHEVFSLMNIDDSKYQISSNILKTLNSFQCPTGGCGIFSYEIAAQKFALANTPISAQLVSNWRVNGLTTMQSDDFLKGFYDPQGLLFVNSPFINGDPVDLPAKGCSNCTFSWNISDEGSDFLTSRELFKFSGTFQDFPKDDDRLRLYNWDRDALGTSPSYLAVSDNYTVEFSDTSRGFVYSCRLLDTNHLLCAQRLELDYVGGDERWSNKGSWFSFANKTKYNHSIISYIGLVKQ